MQSSCIAVFYLSLEVRSWTHINVFRFCLSLTLKNSCRMIMLKIYLVQWPLGKKIHYFDSMQKFHISFAASCSIHYYIVYYICVQNGKFYPFASLFNKKIPANVLTLSNMYTISLDLITIIIIHRFVGQVKHQSQCTSCATQLIIEIMCFLKHVTR